MEKIYKYVNDLHIHVNFKKMEKIDPMEAKPGQIIITENLKAFFVVRSSEGTDDFIDLETGNVDYFDTLFKNKCYLLNNEITITPEIRTILKEV